MERDNNPLQYGLQPYNNGRIQTFLENGVFIVPQGVEEIYASGSGGGGGGGTAASGSGSAIAAGAWGAWSCIKKKLIVAPGMAIPITIGLGGIAEVAGGDTLIGDLLTIPGGLAGVHATTGTSQPQIQTSTPANIVDGLVSSIPPSLWGASTCGSGTLFAAPRFSVVTAADVAGSPGFKYGGGGSAGRRATAGTSVGGKGGDGIAIIEW